MTAMSKACVVNDGWLWTFCLCSSCRTTSGFDNSSFLFAPYTHITGPPDSKHPTDGLKIYSSYPGRRRLFCPTCGCCIFFDRDDRGDLCDAFLGTVDIPVSRRVVVGVYLRVKGKITHPCPPPFSPNTQLVAMFSSWIRQAKSISFWGYAKNKEFAQILANGFCPGKDLSLTEDHIKQSADYDGTLELLDKVHIS
jgi:hypothetical protein